MRTLNSVYHTAPYNYIDGDVTHEHLHARIYTCTHFIVNCGAPLTPSNNRITAIYNSTLEGSLLELSCKNVATAICSPGGMWIPDPNMHTCKSITSDSPGMIIIYTWTTLINVELENLVFLIVAPIMKRDVITTAVVSSIVIFIFSSTLFFILGCACGCVGHKYKTKRSDKNVHSQAAPLYEDLQPSMPLSMPGDQETTNFELRKNVAYGPIKST